MIEVMGNVESNLIGKCCQSIFSEMLYIFEAIVDFCLKELL